MTLHPDWIKGDARIKAYNRDRLGTFNYDAQMFIDQPKMRRGHLPKLPAPEWQAYVRWCVGFTRLMTGDQ